MKRCVRLVVSGAFGAAALMGGAQAQVVPVKPGLWVTATDNQVDGKPGPVEASPLYGLPDDVAQGIRQGLKRYKLPAGWEPGLECQMASSVDVGARLKNLAQSCATPKVKAKNKVITFEAQCTATVPVPTSGMKMPPTTSTINGVIDMSSPVETIMSQKVVSTTGKATQTIELKSVAKWVGSDCSKAPDGIKPEWMSALAR